MRGGSLPGVSAFPKAATATAASTQRRLTRAQDQSNDAGAVLSLREADGGGLGETVEVAAMAGQLAAPPAGPHPLSPINLNQIGTG